DHIRWNAVCEVHSAAEPHRSAFYCVHPVQRHPSSSLFPYTTLFRSRRGPQEEPGGQGARGRRRLVGKLPGASEPTHSQVGPAPGYRSSRSPVAGERGPRRALAPEAELLVSADAAAGPTDARVVDLQLAPPANPRSPW